MFAESTATDIDGESDFEFLDGFPQEVAGPVLEALAGMTENTPIVGLEDRIRMPMEIQREQQQLPRNNPSHAPSHSAPVDLSHSNASPQDSHVNDSGNGANVGFHLPIGPIIIFALVLFVVMKFSGKSKYSR